MILNDKMLDAAFRYRRAEVWKTLCSENIFAVSLSNGETGYCSVMGFGGQHFALGLYIGDRGFAAFYDSLKFADMFGSELFDLTLTLDYINCDFMNADDMEDEVKTVIREYAKAHNIKIPRPHGWPDFTRHSPYRDQCPIMYEADAILITEALDAAVAIGEKLKNEGPDSLGMEDPYGPQISVVPGKKVPLLVPDGNGGYTYSTTELPEYTPYRHEKSLFENDIFIHRIKSLPQSDLTLETRLLHIPMPVYSDTDEDDMVPIFPKVLIAIEPSSDFSMPIMPEKESAENTILLTEFANFLCDDFGYRPKSLLVDNADTYYLLADLCEKCGIELTLSDKRIKRLEDMAYYTVSQFTMFADDDLFDF